MDLRDKVIIITGASSGIGAATAVECARAGMNCVLVARREDRLRAVADQVRTLERRAECVICDVTTPGASKRILDTARQTFGSPGFYAVLANAGYGQYQSILGFGDAEIRRIFETNFFAAADLLREAGRRLLKSTTTGDARLNPAGHLLMTSSCASVMTLAGHGMYSATKAAQHRMCSALRLELEPRGIRVSSIHPIPTVLTEFFEVSDAISDPAYATSTIAQRQLPFFIQTAPRVARAIVSCLRRPRPRGEVWTSTIVRIAAAAMTLSPGVMDLAMRRQFALRRRRRM